MNTFRELLTEALGQPTPLSKAVSVAPTIKRTVGAILAEMGVLAVLEDIEPEERNIKVALKKVGNEYNLYEIMIPTMSKKGKSYIGTYHLYSNRKGEGESDDDATARVIETIKKNVKSEIAKFNAAKNAGKLETARKIIDELIVDEKSAEYELKTLDAGRPIAYPAEKMKKLEKVSRQSSNTREKFLHATGLLSRDDISRHLGIVDLKTLLHFVVAEIQYLADKHYGWKELGSVTDITQNDLNRYLPSAKMDIRLTEFVQKAGINENKLSLDAVEAVTAAALAVSAGVIAANKKIEATYAVR